MNRTVKRIRTSIVSLILAAVMALMSPMQIMASETKAAVYISEIRVGMGKKAAEAESALEGYTIVTDAAGKKARKYAISGLFLCPKLFELFSRILTKSDRKK